MVTQDLKEFNTPVFPFTAIVGQEEMKLALQLNVIDGLLQILQNGQSGAMSETQDVAPSHALHILK